MRELKYHEKKLLKKVNFVQWKSDSTLHEAQVLRRYRVTNRDDYRHYSKLVGYITKLASTLKKLPPTDDYRIETTQALLRKLYLAGLIDTEKSLLKARAGLVEFLLGLLKLLQRLFPELLLLLVGSGHFF